MTLFRSLSGHADAGLAYLMVLNARIRPASIEENDIVAAKLVEVLDAVVLLLFSSLVNLQLVLNRISIIHMLDAKVHSPLGVA